MWETSVKFTTSEFARLHNLNKRTLHYYDEIGLFSPRYREENNYRYYDKSVKRYHPLNCLLNLEN